MQWIPGGVTAARGYLAAGVSAGIKRSRKPDVALVVSEASASVGAVFTRNRVKAAPVVVSQRRARRGTARAVLINSGCANCLTGAAGLQDALRVSRSAATALGIPEQELLIASTGLIGRRLPVARIQRAIPGLTARLGRSSHRLAAEAILTTDRLPKEAAVAATVNGHTFRVGGMAKGAGMIAPSMATMLCVVTTDADIAPALLTKVLQRATTETFNQISVDGDMSTNDTVFALANGRSGVRIRQGTASERRFTDAVVAVTGALAKRIVQDGEGATRVMDVQVTGARSDREAQACARQVACSPLVKTMLAGADPNVGRLAAAVGASSARFDPQQLEIAIHGRQVVAGGAVRTDKAAARTLLARPEVTVRINLHAGRACGRMLTCDLTADYVRINAGYST